MYYQNLINQIDPNVNAKACEGYMRAEHETLNHLSRKQFEMAIREFNKLDAADQVLFEEYV